MTLPVEHRFLTALRPVYCQFEPLERPQHEGPVASDPSARKHPRETGFLLYKPSPTGLLAVQTLQPVILRCYPAPQGHPAVLSRPSTVFPWCYPAP